MAWWPTGPTVRSPTTAGPAREPGWVPMLTRSRAPPAAARLAPPWPATDETYFATDWICVDESWLPKAGMLLPPFVTWWTTRAMLGLRSSRSGPTVPLDPASASVWQLTQLLSNTVLPAATVTAPPPELEAGGDEDDELPHAAARATSTTAPAVTSRVPRMWGIRIITAAYRRRSALLVFRQGSPGIRAHFSDTPIRSRDGRGMVPPMACSVAFLRGINVGRAKRLAMADLRGLCERLGFDEVRTQGQSGNVILETTLRPRALERKLERGIEDELGMEVRVIARTARELEAVLAYDPFGEIATDPSRSSVSFLDGKPPAKALDGIDPADYEPERFRLHGRELYLWLPGGRPRARLPRRSATGCWALPARTATGRP